MSKTKEHLLAIYDNLKDLNDLYEKQLNIALDALAESSEKSAKDAIEEIKRVMYE